MSRPASLLLSGLLLSITTLACSPEKSTDTVHSSGSATTAEATASSGPAQASRGFPETFEAGTKGSYAEGDEQLGSGSWHLVDAMIGSSDQDHKRGQRAARLRGEGRLRMNFDAAAGVRSIRIQSAAYGTDAPSTWELWGSTDGGRTFRRIGQPVQVQGPRLLTTTFGGTTPGPLRLEIRKTDGGSGRLNIDDIELSAASSPAGASTPGSTTDTASPSPTPSRPPTAVVVQRDDNLALGNPSGATSSLDNPTNYLMTKAQYTLGYNAQRGTPTWVSWHLNRAWRGSAPRQDDFRPDPALPRGFYPVTRNSYANSGFDKGHNCPSADRTTDLDDNSATFLMTNIIPQAPNNNQRTWGDLEEWARTQVDRGQELYVVMGCYGKGGTGLKGLKTTLDNGRVTVPARIWKVLVVLPEGADDLQRIAAGQARIIAVDTPNDQSVTGDWGRYRVSVDAIEAATGLDLLSKLPVDVQTRLQAQVDAGSTR